MATYSWRTIELVKVDGDKFAYQQKMYQSPSTAPPRPTGEHRLTPIEETLNEETEKRLVKKLDQ